MKNSNLAQWFKIFAARGGIIIFFIIAFEVMIMISPFAFFFYSVFNPFLHWLDSYTATRWLTAFFLPHMILPPTLFLKAIRIAGSILFVMGCVTFIICAFQVYLGKIFKWGIAQKGLYKYVRHPQYLALGLWGIGMAILWARFLVLASLSLMFILYYFLAKDEERRMLSRYGEGYRSYMAELGMFLPKRIETYLAYPYRPIRSNTLRYASISFSIIFIVIGSGFLLRSVTLHSIGLSRAGNITIVTILPEDAEMGKMVLGKMGANGLEFIDSGKDYLAYLMPGDYIMQGMIANTGDEFHLHKGHNTFALIADWVIHPFEHLRRSPAARMAKMHGVDPMSARRRHCPMRINDPNLSCESCPYRRIIFIEIDHAGNSHIAGEELFSFEASRIPVGFSDVNTLTGQIVTTRRVEKATAWRDVPTPSI
ncbi:MAG: methyltransferase family protein [Syntrophobacteraceae bacterium]